MAGISVRGVNASSRATNKVGDCRRAGKCYSYVFFCASYCSHIFHFLSLSTSSSSRPLHLSLGGQSHSFSGMLSSPCHGPLGHIGWGLDPPPPVSLEPIN